MGHSATPASEIKRALRAAPAGALLPPWANDYTGIPFAPKGYDRAGCNCWGLVCLVYAERLGIALSRHEEAYDERLLSHEAKLPELRQIAAAIGARKGDWREVAWYEARVCDVVLMPRGDALCHVGLYVGDLHILHVEEGCDSVCEDLRLGLMDARLKRSEIYRYVGAGC